MSQSARALLSRCSDELARAETIYIAFSGGLDSTVLLHAVASQFPVDKLRALHVNHGLSPNSDLWQDHCAQVANKLSVQLLTFAVDVRPRGKGVEKAARDARYQIFEDILKSGDCLLMAHHQDDQAETILYRLLRGAGPAGLAGMPEKRTLGEGTLLRPFLEVTRGELFSTATEQGLSWIEDESNASPDFDRNYLRARVIPAIAERWPDYRQRFARAAENCRSSAVVLDLYGRRELAGLELRTEKVGSSIALLRFLETVRDSQLNILRAWVSEEKRAPCGHQILESVLDDLVLSRADACPVVRWEGGEFRRYRERLHLLPAEFSSCEDRGTDHQIIDSRNFGAGVLVDAFGLELRPASGGRALRIAASDRVEIGVRKGGERCQPVGRAHSAPLKKLFQEYGLEPWLRDRVPLVFVNGNLAAVAGLFLCEGFQCAEGETGWMPEWSPGGTR
jgi:tRNA(Ile)-lysidine synthase